MDAAKLIAARTGGEAIGLDLTSSASILQTCTQLAESDSILAGVILAGSPPPSLGPFGKISEQELQLQLQVNVLGPQLLLANIVRNCFRKVKQGTVVGVLTQAMGNQIGNAAAGMGAYVIAKYGQAGLLAALAADYPWLRVGAVHPGYTETRMLKVFDERFLAAKRESVCFSSPADVATTIVKEALGS